MTSNRFPPALDRANSKTDASVDTLYKLLRYDAESGKLFWRKRPAEMFRAQRDCKAWNTQFAGAEALFTLSASGYYRGRVVDKIQFAHRVIWAMHYGQWPHGQIDHIDGNRTNNHISNLRDVPQSLNQRNAKMRVDNTSGHVGVSRRHGKWRAVIRLDGKLRQLGSFTSIDDAIAARKSEQARHGFTSRHGRVSQ